MVTQSTSLQLNAPSQSWKTSLLARVVLSRISNLTLFLLLASSFVITAKVLISPFATPVSPVRQPISSLGTKVLNPDQINCVPSIHQVCAN